MPVSVSADVFHKYRCNFEIVFVLSVGKQKLD